MELPEGMTVRNFSPEDLDVVRGFKEKSVRISFPDADYDIEAFRRNLLSSSEKEPDSVKVVEKGGRVVGYIWFRIKSGITGNLGIINHVFIDDSVRKLGLASSLMKIAEEFFMSRDIKRVRVTITLTNEPSIRMCKKMGYREKRVIMEKEL